MTGHLKYRHLAESLVQDDENEVGKIHGQRVAKIFHDADFIANLDVETSIETQVDRFCATLFWIKPNFPISTGVRTVPG